MGNITRAEIQNQIYQYIPHMNQAAKLTLVNNAIDLALERISRRHNFVCLRGATVATATITAGQYSFARTSLGPRVWATSSIGQGVDWIKDIISLWLFDVSGDVTKFVRYMDLKEFDNTYSVEEIASRGSAAADHYTRVGGTYLLSAPADKAYELLARYQMYHPRFSLWSTCTFTTTTTSGTTTSTLNPSTATIWFDAEHQMTALNAIVYTALTELKSSLNSVEFPQELQAVESLAKQWVSELIEADKDIMDEDFALGWAERSDSSSEENPYDWVP